jgi:hypothetical protein
VTVHAVIKGNVSYNREVTILLRKERATHALIIPVREWRIVGTQNLGINPEQF